jgi:hypothetical protein
MLTERQVDFISIAATLYLPAGHDVKSFFSSVRLGRNPGPPPAESAIG